MNDRYLFRGKRLDNREWVYGVPIYDGGGDLLIITEVMSEITCCSDCGMPDVIYYIVNLATLGQCTGIKDKNGKLIFEGDVYKMKYPDLAFAVEWDGENGRFLGVTHTLKDTTRHDRMIAYVGREPPIEIIGNIHDNPELLTKEATTHETP